MKIINLTQHPATPEQVAAGVVDLEGEMLAHLKTLLNFEELPTPSEVYERAGKIADITEDFPRCLTAMIGGAPFLMAPLVEALRLKEMRAVCAFSKRESVEETLPDGTVKKVSVFRHTGFVPAI